MRHPCLLELCMPQCLSAFDGDPSGVVRLGLSGRAVEAAARMMGVSTTAATMWWRQAGAMPTTPRSNAEGALV